MGGCIIKEKESSANGQPGKSLVWKLNWIPAKGYRLEKYDYKNLEETIVTDVQMQVSNVRC